MKKILIIFFLPIIGCSSIQEQKTNIYEQVVIELTNTAKLNTLSYRLYIIDDMIYLDLINRIGRHVFVKTSDFRITHQKVISSNPEIFNWSGRGGGGSVSWSGKAEFTRLGYNDCEDDDTYCGCNITRIASTSLGTYDSKDDILEIKASFDTYVGKWSKPITFKIIHKGSIRELYKSEEKPKGPPEEELDIQILDKDT